MAATGELKATLVAASKGVAALQKANAALAVKQQAERDKAVQAANDAGLSVDAGALPTIGASEAQPRYLTLLALLTDAVAQLEQIEGLTA